MTTNIMQTNNWAKMALSELKRAKILKKELDYPGFMFHAQLGVEKLGKSLLILFGIKVERTHTPTRIIIDRLIKTNNILKIEISKELKDLLLEFVEHSLPLEMERTIPRYGLDIGDEFIIPERFYTKERAAELGDETYLTFSTYLKILKKIGATSKFSHLILNIEEALSEFRN